MAPGPHGALNLVAKFCPHRNNTNLQAGFSCPNPLTHPSDTETDSAPDPDLASPSAFSGSLQAK
ncbi:MAG: hypothetical protein ACOX52_19930 [Verrucomicrobiota bacterium]